MVHSSYSSCHLPRVTAGAQTLLWSRGLWDLGMGGACWLGVRGIGRAQESVAADWECGTMLRKWVVSGVMQREGCSPQIHLKSHHS